MCDKNQYIYTNGLAVLLGRDGSQVPLVKEFIYIPTSRKEWGKYGMVFNLCAPIYSACTDEDM